EVRVLLSRGFPLPGEPSTAVGTTEDVTARRRTERELEQARERLDRAVQATSEGLWEWDVRSGEAWYSARYRELLGHGAGDDPELPPRMEAWEARLHPEDRERALRDVRRHLEEGLPYESEYRLRLRDG